MFSFSVDGTFRSTSSNEKVRSYFISIFPFLEVFSSSLISFIQSSTPDKNVFGLSTILFLQNYLHLSSYIEADIFSSLFIEKKLFQNFGNLIIQTDYISELVTSLYFRIASESIAKYQFYVSHFLSPDSLSDLAQKSEQVESAIIKSQISLFLMRIMRYFKFPKKDLKSRFILPDFVTFSYMYVEEFELFHRVCDDSSDENSDFYVSKALFDSSVADFLRSLKLN